MEKIQSITYQVNLQHIVTYTYKHFCSENIAITQTRQSPLLQVHVSLGATQFEHHIGWGMVTKPNFWTKLTLH
jgi:hypothetical protein